MSNVAFAVRHLTKSFPGRAKGEQRRVVIDDLSLTIHEQEFICILGPSGCGKSTFLNLLSGLDSSYDGELEVAGKTIRGSRLPLRVGYLFQEPRLLPWLTAEDNVNFVLSASKVPTAKWDALKDRYFKMAGLQGFRKHYPHQMSGGMCQRLALVRALSVEPEVLLMDEPFSGLDELTGRRMRMDLMQIWQQTHKTIIFVTHNSYEATFLAQRILIMANGKVRKEIAIDIPTPREYDDPAIFEANRHVLRSFLEVADVASIQ
jgi:NitT/TauT family transport system ATP-binding protein